MHLERAAEAAVSIYRGSKEPGKIAEILGRRATGNRALGEVRIHPYWRALDGRHAKGGRRTMTVRVPEFSSETELPFAAYSRPSNPTRGAYALLLPTTSQGFIELH